MTFFWTIFILLIGFYLYLCLMERLLKKEFREELLKKWIEKRLEEWDKNGNNKD